MGASDEEVRAILEQLRAMDRAEPAPMKPGDWLKTLLAPGLTALIAGAGAIWAISKSTTEIETALATIKVQQSSVIERLGKVENKLDGFSEWVATSRTEHSEFRRKFEDLEFRMKAYDPSRYPQRRGETPQQDGLAYP